MAHEIISVERIKREARQYAQTYANVNDACPYSFQSEAGKLFKQEFFIAREEKQKGVTV
ncbi:hypothetical protein [Rhodoferax ferrireducens]|uniref:hypothetical protein n=1 Tax=Rhodoferax ferrireducens TaxID=192843 RepID=UPI00130038B1|nr:hypothetical protein [Rhodoferax ferrireducens]